MHLSRRTIAVTLPVTLSLALAAVALTAAVAPTSTSNMAAVIPSGTTIAEVEHFHAHLDSVLRDLQAADVAQLNDMQRSHRENIVASLASYEARNQFPHNYDFPGAPTPYFVDRKTGALCAVAHLLNTTGRRDIVDRVARTNNNAWVADLASDTAFTSWLDMNGLSLADAAHIQVPYTSSSTIVAAQILAGTGLAAITTSAFTGVYNGSNNSRGQHRKVAVLGVVAGGMSTAIGAIALQAADVTGGMKVAMQVSTGVGVLSILTSTSALLGRKDYLAEKAKNDLETDRKRANVEASIAPIIPMGKSSGPGVSMQIRF